MVMIMIMNNEHYDYEFCDYGDHVYDIVVMKVAIMNMCLWILRDYEL